jgi:hypothetical protein
LLTTKKQKQKQMSTEYPYLTTTATLGAVIYPYIVRQTTYIAAQKAKVGNPLNLPEWSFNIAPNDRKNRIVIQSELNRLAAANRANARYFVGANGTACPCNNGQ